MKNQKIKSNSKEGLDKFDTYGFSKSKIAAFQRMVTQTILAVQRYKGMDIMSASELNVCIQSLEPLYAELEALAASLEGQPVDYEAVMTRLQKTNNELSVLFRTFGTQSIEDLISVAMGSDFINTVVLDDNRDLYEIIRLYVHPISYKVMVWKDAPSTTTSGKLLAKNRIVEDFMIVEKSKSFDCFDLARTSRSFLTKVHGIKVAIQNPTDRKTLIISGLVDDLILECTNHAFIKRKMKALRREKPSDPDFHTKDFDRFLATLTIKDILIYSSSELYQRFVGYLNQAQLIRQKPISQSVKEFIGGELYGQRKMLIQLLMKHNDPEFQYLAYLLYDLLSSDTNGTIDTLEQTVLFDSLPWNIKKFFRDAMKTTISYTKSLSSFDNNKIPIEQQICLLKAKDSVKEKAMIKLKEVKAKSEDSGSKARQYLEGLLKVPFGIYRSEPMLSTMKDVGELFVTTVRQANSVAPTEFAQKDSYSSLEVSAYSRKMRQGYLPALKAKEIGKVIDCLCAGRRNTLIANVCMVNAIIKRLGIKAPRLRHSGRKNADMRAALRDLVELHQDNASLMKELRKSLGKSLQAPIYSTLSRGLNSIEKKWGTVSTAVKQIKDTLQLAVHGHESAKRQIERIIGQWINGEQSGYCFGFEGPPGVGKTSLAKKGLARCLKGVNGEERPFAFIAVGGSSNGSTLCGHNYTYVGSTWGRIVDILMEKKCMNPIIFIDELDKVSRSEHGKEIIGILTHLVDGTQNDCFQDKYFSGIDLDLSKALFIFSYNDPSLIDRVLLDRIHRVKFDHLSLEDKLIIAKDYLLPEIFQNIGLEGAVVFPDEVVELIVEKYTYEPGVRKLKEILFEIISEVNLEILHSKAPLDTIPIVMTETDVATKYLKERDEVIRTKVPPEPAVGVINGLWANALGKGGIIPIECFLFPAGGLLDLKLTGMQGDVMQESMNVAKTLAWNMTPAKQREALMKRFRRNKRQGIHIHCPEGATPKDGPSAGTAITVAIYSRFNDLKIKNDIAITGEINLQGAVTAIGGLDKKIVGGARCGVREFIYPQANERDFKKLLDKYDGKEDLGAIRFHKVSTIEQVFELVFVE